MKLVLNLDSCNRAPHPLSSFINWKYPYSIEKAFFPIENLKKEKFWPTCNRIGSTGDLYINKKLSKFYQS